jgi:UDP-N-acetylglucosamine 2-epimerase (non-hydrolysing)
MLKILSIFGTRPEAIKMAPVIKELAKYPGEIQSVVCVTGQHRQMLDQVLDIFEIKPHCDLNLMERNQTLAGLTAKMMTALQPLFDEVKPDWVLVQGDTTTVMSASLAAFYRDIKVGHIEAGLRTRDKRAPFPEEINRRITSVLADFHFAPTDGARKALLSEGVADASIQVTGNTVIDALMLTLEKIKSEAVRVSILSHLSSLIPSIPWSDLETGGTKSICPRILLVTGHRRESFGKPFEEICLALRDVVSLFEDIHVVYPVHLNPNVREPVHRILGGVERVHLLEPLSYLPFVYLMDKAYCILTDSGGVQEEAPSLGKPVFVMRDVTERPEGIEAGCSALVGTTRDSILNRARTLLTDEALYKRMSHARNPYGDGHAAEKIVARLKDGRRGATGD